MANRDRAPDRGDPDRRASDRSAPDRRVLIVGGGIAGLEAALALRQLAGDELAVTMLEPQAELVLRPMSVGEPFASRTAERRRLQSIADDVGFELRAERFGWLDRSRRIVHTREGSALEYDALLLAVGASRTAPYRDALTLDDRHLDEQLHGVVQDLELGYVRSLAFVVPPGAAWPLPVYELALMTAHRAYDMNVEASISLVTPERFPLEIFGTAAGDEVARRLRRAGIATFTSTAAAVHRPHEIDLGPGVPALTVERIIALPELAGPSLAGVPHHLSSGFLDVDARCRVRGVERVFAAGDVTNLPVKHGSLAAQQAATAAQGIAALAGLAPEPAPLAPILRGLLLGDRQPLYLSARLSGTRGIDSVVSAQPLWTPVSKVAAPHLSAYLQLPAELPEVG